MAGRALSLVHLQVLFALDTEGPLSMRHLAEAMDVSQASATGIVDRMEQRGLVERLRDDADRRVVRVALAEGGRQTIGVMASERRERLAQILDQLTDAELEGFLAGLRGNAPRPRGAARDARGQQPRRPRGAVPLIRLFRDYLPPYRWPIVLVLLLLLVQAIANLYLPELNAEIINNGVATGDTDYILRTGGFMLVVTFALMVAAIIAVYFGAKIAMGFGRDVRGASSARSRRSARSSSTGSARPSLITRNTNDVQQVQTGHADGPEHDHLGADPDRRRRDHGAPPGRALTGILLVIIPIMALLIARSCAGRSRCSRRLQSKIDRINQVMREALPGIRVIRAFVRTRHEEQRFDEAKPRPLGHGPARQPAVRAHAAGVAADHEPVVGGGALPGRLPGRQRRDAHRQPDRVPAVHHADPVRDHDRGHHVRVHPAGIVSGGRIREVLGHGHDRRPADADRAVRRGTVEFRDVTFGYPGAEEPVLRDISFRPTRARRRPSSAPRGAARPRWSTCCRASTT